jgi:hypothetical protein
MGPVVTRALGLQGAECNASDRRIPNVLLKDLELQVRVIISQPKMLPFC